MRIPVLPLVKLLLLLYMLLLSERVAGSVRMDADDDVVSTSSGACDASPIQNDTDSSGQCSADSPLHHPSGGSLVSPSWCRSVCCGRADCIGWTFTDPQPGDPKKDVDCWIKTSGQKMLPGKCGGSPKR
jgi:hypothetical protein